MTWLSESQTRSVAAIGNSRVIPAKAGIQVGTLVTSVEPGTSFTFETGHMLYTRIFGRMMLLVRLRASNTPSGN